MTRCFDCASIGRMQVCDLVKGGSMRGLSQGRGEAGMAGSVGVE